MARSLALLALSGAVVAAQTATVTLLLPFADQQPLVGSVISADSTATTYAYGCPPGGDSDECGFPASETITQGPSTWIYTMSYDDGAGNTNIQGGHCKITTSADNADCTVWATIVESDTTTSTTSTGATSFLDFQIPVTITAGADKLKATPGASATDGSTSAPTTAAASQTSASTGASHTTFAKQTTGTSTASSSAKPSSTNAAGVVNAQGGLLAGVAAIVGGAMML